MGKEIILKGYVSENGKIGEGNAKLTLDKGVKEESQVVKYVDEVSIKIYASDIELPLEELKKTEPKQFYGSLQIHMKIKDNGVVEFNIENKELEKHSKDYVGKYICVLIQIKE